jgi:hypothetical protein
MKGAAASGAAGPPHDGLTELDATIEARLADALTELDRDARGRHRRLLGGCLVAVLGVGASIGMLALFPGADALGIVAVAACAYFLWSAWSAHRGFAAAFRERVIGPLVGFVDASLRYEPSASVPREQLVRSGLVRREVRYCSGEDLVEGEIDGVAVRCTYVRAFGETPRRAPGSDSVAPPIVFSGLFVLAEFPRRATAGVYVLPDRAERLFGGVAEAVQAADRRYGSLVRLEDPEFERLFKVYAEDQVEARYILSTSLMDRLVNFRNRRDATPRLAIQNSTLYMAFPSNANPLAPPSWAEVAYTQKTETGGALIRRRLAGYVEDLRLVADVVRDLRLDVRIWSREAPG